MPPVEEVKAPNRRLDSWKEIAAFFDRDERTVKRWEKDRNLPVHRLPGGARARVFAFTEELHRWMNSEPPSVDDDSLLDTPEMPGIDADDGTPPGSAESPARAAASTGHHRKWAAGIGLAILVTCIVLGVLLFHWRRAAALTRDTPQRRRAVPADRPPSQKESSEAEELYLQGRYYWNKRTPEDLRRAVDLFTQAIVRDPNYAKAYVGLADCYNLLREFAAMPPQEAFPLALAAARKAVELDPASAEAQASLAFSTWYWSWDFPAAEHEFRRAIELNPDYGPAHHWLANCLVLIGRVAEGLQEINRAEQLDPGSVAILADKALVLYNLGRPEEAIGLLKEIEKSQPDFYSTHRYLSYIYLSRHDDRNYLVESLKAATLAHDHQQLEIARAAEQGFKLGGEVGMFRNTLRAQEQLYRREQMSPFLLAVSYARLGENDKALSYLETSYRQHDPYFLSIRVDQGLVPLHAHAEYRKLLAASGMPPL